VNLIEKVWAHLGCRAMRKEIDTENGI